MRHGGMLLSTEISFGDYLRTLLAKRGLSATDLARKISLHESYIRRWLRGERVPSLSSGHVNRIAECLELSNIEKDAVKAAQIFSLEQGQTGADNSRRVQQLLQQAQYRDRLTDKFTPESSNQDCFAGIPDLSDIPPVIQGRRSVLQAAIAILKAAAGGTPEQDREILLTFQGDQDYFLEYVELVAPWRRAVLAALHKGWDFRHLWQLSKDANRSLRLVQDMLEMLGLKGRYQPFYFARYGVVIPSYELLLVPNIGALLGFSTQQAHSVDAAFFYRDPKAFEVLDGHFAQLFNQTVPLIKAYPVHDPVLLSDVCVEAEERPGDRLSVKDGLSEFTLPLPINGQYPQEATQGIIGIQIANHQRRLAAFRKQVQEYRFRDICPKSAIERLVIHGQYAHDDQCFFTERTVTENERQAHLRNVVEFLRQYDNYEVALVDDTEGKLITSGSWLVKGDHTILLETWSQRDEGDCVEIDLEITEPAIVGAFRGHFAEIWEGISPQNRAKEYVIWWLEQQIDQIRPGLSVAHWRPTGGWPGS